MNRYNFSFLIPKSFSFLLILFLSLSSFSDSTWGTEVSPYFFSWGYNSSQYKVRSLMDAKRKANLKNVTIAFAITKGQCRFDGSIDAMKSDIKKFISTGGKVIISFGGALGTYIESACKTDDSLFAAIDRLILSTGVTNLDFDIEGEQLKVSNIQQRRTRVLVRLQKKYPQMYLSYTLPVSARSGLNKASLDLISQSVVAGLKINIINLMTMDYYYTLPGKTMGDLAILSVEKSLLQIEKYFPKKSIQQLYAMIGLTPMIGLNDDQFIFTRNDAKKVTAYAQKYDIGLISYWAFQRDQLGSNNINKYSGQNTYDFEYYDIFKASEL